MMKVHLVSVFFADGINWGRRSSWLKAALGLILLCLGVSQGFGPARADLNDEYYVFGESLLDETYDMAWGDYDNDGDLDVAVALNGRNRVYENKGGLLVLGWTEPAYITPDAYTSGVAWGDFNGDGYLDLAFANVDQPSSVYVNDGNGNLERYWLMSGRLISMISVAWGDWDGDGDLDLSFGSGSNGIYIYENDAGDFWFDPDVSLGWKSAESMDAKSLAWADVDGNGYLDLAVAAYCGPIYIYQNIAGSMTMYWPSTTTWCGRSVEWGDWDGDGDLDLAVGSDTDYGLAVFENDGTGVLIFDPGGGYGWQTSSQDDSIMSVAWGDWDGDGDLDLAAARWPYTRVYENAGGSLQLNPGEYGWISPVMSQGRSVAWGDVDNDGDLDLAVANYKYGNHVHLNRKKSMEVGWTLSFPANDLAWGDYDDDGDLDLAVGNDDAVRIYENSGGLLSCCGADGLELSDVFDTYSLAWGDWNIDGDLDLAIGGSSSVRVYENLAAQLLLAWQAPENAIQVAWGDWDNDKDLDLAIASFGAKVYENLGNFLDFDPQNGIGWQSSQNYSFSSVSWGDWDNDSDLDLALGNYNGGYEYGRQNLVYENLGGDLQFDPSSGSGWASQDVSFTNCIAWGDYDSDGDLDLMSGNYSGASYLYENDLGTLQLAPWDGFGLILPDIRNTKSVAWGDMDGDGDLDLALGNDFLGLVPYEPIQVYENQDGNLRLAWSSEQGYHTRKLAWGDVDNDGDLDLAVGHDLGTAIYKNGRQGDHKLQDEPLLVYIRPPGASAYANFYASGEVIDEPVVPLEIVLADSQNDPVSRLEAYYSVNGGGYWKKAIPLSTTNTTNLIAPSFGAVHLFDWDVFASGFFGQSDNVLLRMVAYPGHTTAAFGAPGPFQWPYIAATSFPFRLRGTQVRVMRPGMDPAMGAQVYRIPKDQPYGSVMADDSGKPYFTDGMGYLRGHGELHQGDHLVAISPFTGTETYTLYHTSAAPTTSGLAMHEVTAAGVQTLTVSADNLLVLFNLDVSLQWDARYDSNYIDQTAFDLGRASELLYDWTDGQAALGRVRVYHNRENWNDAHIRIYASNKMRPMALQGGIVSEVISDTQVSSIAYAPGQVHMGAVWSRYGGAGSSLGDDWPRALAHELGHYVFYLNDNYIGLNESGQLIPVDKCPGAMADPYRDDWSEFHPDLGWLPACERTLSQQMTGRSDWATILEFYPELAEGGTNSGPSLLPLGVTQIEWVEPVTPTQALEDPTFYLVSGSDRAQPGRSARAFLYQDGWALDLGGTKQDRVTARGAKAGDRLCVYELDAKRLGCKTLQTETVQLELYEWPEWQPEIIVTPVNSVTVGLEVSNLASGLDLRAKLYPFTGPEVMTATLVESGEAYSTTYNLAEAVLEGYIQVWVEEAEPRREAIIDFAVGGNPGRMRGSGGRMRGSGGRMRGSGAPVMSSDGYVMLFADETQMEADEFYTLQAASLVPEPPAWSTVVGNAYRLSASENAPDLSEASVSFAYLGDDVPEGEESWLRVYYRGPASTSWQVLPTALDAYHNTASAPAQGEGMYALMSSLEIPLEYAGWNLISYPVQATRPVSDALRSIEDYYGIVYGYDGGDATDPWKVYAQEAPGYVNDLYDLEFGHGYWISVTQAITLYLKGASEEPLAPADAIGGLPPTTYYGEVIAGTGFTPIPNMPVTAWVNGKLCGQGATRQYGGMMVYVVDVQADGWGSAAGCGAPGKTVSFEVGGQMMEATGAWDNRRLWRLDLHPQGGPFSHVFLPLVSR